MQRRIRWSDETPGLVDSRKIKGKENAVVAGFMIDSLHNPSCKPKWTRIESHFPIGQH